MSRAPSRLTLLVMPFLLGALAWVIAAGEAQAQLSPEQHRKLVDYARSLGERRIAYKGNIQYDGDKWMMDCSNTSRYIYQSLFNIKIPRVASSQYWVLKQEGKVTHAQYLPDGSVDRKHILSKLRSGDLLFWEWTYNIKRSPPVSHVMIYLGRTADGTPKMVGSATRARGEVTKRGGVDVYTFNPNAPMGGVKNIFGGYAKKARFVGFGRVIHRDDKQRFTHLQSRNQPD